LKAFRSIVLSHLDMFLVKGLHVIKCMVAAICISQELTNISILYSKINTSIINFLKINTSIFHFPRINIAILHFLKINTAIP